jgi:putative ABC transport system permease protein
MLLLATLFSHYRRHPVQGMFLLVGIIIANVLLVGTLLINAQARASYTMGEQVLRVQPIGSIVSRAGARSIAEQHYIALRRKGFATLAPLLQRFVRTEQGDSIELLGIDILAIPRSGRGAAAAGGGFASASSSANTGTDGPGFAGFTLPPYSLWASPARIKQLGWREGNTPRMDGGNLLPPVAALAGEGLGHRLLLDIGVLQTLTGSAGEISEILVFESTPETIEALQTALPVELKWLDTRSELDPAQLTRSFHLNLAAMGLLAFVVGVFLIYNALAFSYTDRHELLRKLRLAGVTRGELCRVLLLELAAFVIVGSLMGFVLGSWLAAKLLPGVGLTLAQLYGVYIAYPDKLLTGGLGLPLAMTGIAAGLCVLFPLRQALTMPVLERQSPGWQQASAVQRDRVLFMAGIALLILAAVLAVTANALWLALACMASLLLGAALCLPSSLRLLLGAASRLVPPTWARTSWLLADSRWLLGPAALALMAITLALVSNSGLNTMIGSFRQATESWLQQRLVAEIYVTGEASETRLKAWLKQRAPAAGVAARYTTRLVVPAPAGAVTTIEVISLPANQEFINSVDLMQGRRGAKAVFRDGAGVFISERAMRLDGWQPGQEVQVCPGHDAIPVLGVYRDYGNPQSQWMLSERLFKKCWPGMLASGFGLIGPPGIMWNKVRADLIRDFGLAENEVINQQELMVRGLSVFDRTFSVTQALNALTLLVASIGIFCAVSAIHHHRLPQQALLAALGVTRRERATLLLLQWGLLGLFCIVLVWPFGALLAWVLAAVVTPVAFGWSFALQPEWKHLPMLALLGSGSLLLAVLLPSLQLLQASPGQLLRQRSV